MSYIACALIYLTSSGRPLSFPFLWTFTRDLPAAFLSVVCPLLAGLER